MHPIYVMRIIMQCYSVFEVENNKYKTAAIEELSYAFKKLY